MEETSEERKARITRDLDMLSKLLEEETSKELKRTNDYCLDRKLHITDYGKKMLVGERGSGLTYSAIRYSAKHQIPILVQLTQRAATLKRKSVEMGYDMPYPVIVNDNLDSRTIQEAKGRVVIDSNGFIDRAIRHELERLEVNKDDVEFITIGYMDKHLKYATSPEKVTDFENMKEELEEID